MQAGSSQMVIKIESLPLIPIASMMSIPVFQGKRVWNPAFMKCLYFVHSLVPERKPAYMLLAR